jgi:predicted nucleic acid-binding protein
MAARRSEVTLLANVPLALEYEATCQLAEHRLAAGLDLDDVGIFIDAVLAMVEPVEAHFMWRPQLRDPADELVLEAAVNGRAPALVTFNRRDFGSVPALFGIDVLTPAEARKWESRAGRLQRLPPCSSQGQALDPRIARG